MNAPGPLNKPRHPSLTWNHALTKERNSRLSSEKWEILLLVLTFPLLHAQMGGNLSSDPHTWPVPEDLGKGKAAVRDYKYQLDCQQILSAAKKAHPILHFILTINLQGRLGWKRLTQWAAWLSGDLNTISFFLLQRSNHCCYAGFLCSSSKVQHKSEFELCSQAHVLKFWGRSRKNPLQTATPAT